MAPLINNQKNSAPLNITAPPANSQQQAGLPPSAMSALAASTACGVLGFISALPKHDCAQLLTLSKDTFDKETKNIANLDESSEMKKAFKRFLELKDQTTSKTTELVNGLFGDKTSLTLAEINTKLNTTDISESIADIAKKIDDVDFELTLKTENGQYELLQKILGCKDGITADIHTAIDALDENVKGEGYDPKIMESYKQALKDAFPIGEKIENAEEAFKKVVKEQTDDKFAELKTLFAEKQKLGIMSRVVAAAENGPITKETAENIIKQGVTDYNLDRLMSEYKGFAKKLPKARLKSACKYFGLGFLTILVTDFALSLFRRSRKS